MSRKILQIILAMIALLAIITGLAGIITGITNEFYSVSNVKSNILLDSNLRYFSGLWLGLGLIIFWIIPSIEKQKIIVRLIFVMIFIGGIGRVFSMVNVGSPPTLYKIFTFLEIISPILIFWQNKIAKSYT